jgi:hypothetical protein
MAQKKISEESSDKTPGATCKKSGNDADHVKKSGPMLLPFYFNAMVGVRKKDIC